VTNLKLLSYVYSHVQELVRPHITPLNKDTFSTVSGVLKERAVKLAVNNKLSASETALASARMDLGQRDTANAALAAANIEFEKKAAATAEATALLSKKLCSVFEMLKKAMPDEVSNYSIHCWCILDTFQCILLTVLTLL
jgi:hypothetical protein